MSTFAPCLPRFYVVRIWVCCRSLSAPLWSELLFGVVRF